MLRDANCEIVASQKLFEIAGWRHETPPLIPKPRRFVSDELRIEGDSIMAEIFLTNLPHDCCDMELRAWAESRGIVVKSTRIILDLETGVAPAFGYVEVENISFVKSGAAKLNGRKFRTNTVMAKPVQIVPRDFNRSTVSP